MNMLQRFLSTTDKSKLIFYTAIKLSIHEFFYFAFLWRNIISPLTFSINWIRVQEGILHRNYRRLGIGKRTHNLDGDLKHRPAPEQATDTKLKCKIRSRFVNVTGQLSY